MDRIDILNRDIFVDNLVKLVEKISDNEASTSFAINGVWGCGKSFVLDMFEDRLSKIQSEETSKEKFFIIRYNSWKFDYYEEPLLAIVSNMISAIEEKTKLFPDSKAKREVIGMLKAAGVSLLSLGNVAIKEKTGVDIQQAYEVVVNGGKAGAEEYEKNHNYDMYFGFNKVLSELTDLLQDIAEDYTVVFLVDELDRCLPGYAIKVIERLHHLTEGKSNIITITAIDKNQIINSIKQIFGFENPENYLKKFFNFEVNLDYGVASEKIKDKYYAYIDLFDENIFVHSDSIEECLQGIFTDVDIRTQEQIVKKVTIAHKLLYKDKKDYSFMCMELIIAVIMSVWKKDKSFLEIPVKISGFESVFVYSRRNEKPAFSDFFKQKFENLQIRINRAFSDDPTLYILQGKPSLYGAILYTWYWMHERNPGQVVQHITGDSYSVISDNHEELLKFVDFINLMK